MAIRSRSGGSCSQIERLKEIFFLNHVVLVLVVDVMSPTTSSSCLLVVLLLFCCCLTSAQFAERVCDASSVGRHELASLFARCQEVVIPSGSTVVSGPLNLTSGQILTLQQNSTLQAVSFSKSVDWPILVALPTYPLRGPRYQPFLHVAGALNVTIRGPGTVDGAGASWWGEKNLAAERPRLVGLERCTGCRMTGTRFQNSPFWTIHIVYSVGVAVEGVSVFNPPEGKNTDGLDVDSSRDVQVRNCHIETEDDCISIKSGLLFDSNLPCLNVLIADSTFRSCAGLAVGSETAGGVQNITFQSLKLENIVGGVVRLKTKRANGAYIDNVVYDTIAASRCVTGIFLDPDYEAVAVPPGVLAPKIGTIVVRNFTASLVARAAELKCTSDSPCDSFVLDNVVMSSLLGWSCSHANGTTMGKVHPKPCW